MQVKRFIARFWRLIQPTSVLAARMRKDWDERARKNARYFVATAKENWTDENFFESGRDWIRLYVLPDLTLISRGRPIAELNMLELGCGAGRMTRGFSEMFRFVDAVDVSTEMIKKAEAVLSDCSNVAFHVNNGVTLPMFSDNSFDFIFSGIVFQHIPSKSIIRSYIREASRLLRSGSVFKFQVDGIPKRRRHTDSWHGAGLSEDEIVSMANRYGFIIHSSMGAGTQYFLAYIHQEMTGNPSSHRN
jgi:SAM-dependent methyltransferase